MPTQDQLEVITPSGEVKFYDLDPAKGVTNIGRHPDNDIIIEGPSVAPFYAVLDHQQKPYQFMILSQEGTATLGGQPLPPNVFQEIQNWDTVEIDGYAIILLEGKAPVIMPSLAGPFPPLAQVPAPRPETPAVAPMPGMPVDRPILTEQADEIILTEISARELIVDVEQSVAVQVTVINGGNIVATFDIRLEGVDESWVDISPPQVNLYEGAQATVAISITAPRLPTSAAGSHPLAVVVTSPNHPGHVSRTGVTLTINPYREFAVSDLSPKEQTVYWSRRFGEAVITITNKGNSETAFRLEGRDNEQACRFEFQVPDEGVTLAGQAEVRPLPGETIDVPMRITPPRRLIGMRKRLHSFTVTTSMTGGEQMPRSVMGQLKNTSLLGLLHFVLMALFVAILIVAIFRPQIIKFEAEPGRVRSGEPVLLSWEVSRFAKPRIDPDVGSVEGPKGQATALPVDNVTTYQLEANNWLSRLSSTWFGASAEARVYVGKITPVIDTFTTTRKSILAGQTVTLFWKVTDAEILTLAHGGIEETLKDAELESGQRSFTLEQTTDFSLIATHSSSGTPVEEPLRITVDYPTATPVPTPVILRFDVNPLVITLGESVRVDWEVSGADSVSVSNLGAGLPLKGDVGHQPVALTNYQLTAHKSAPDGTTVENKSLLREVVVNLPPTPTPTLTPTPTPAPPEIQLFEATPKEVVLGDNQVVKLSWSVAGETTNVEITAPDLKLSGLKSQDVVNVTVNETTLFVLTAYNGEWSRSTAAEVAVLEPTPTVTPTPTATPTETPTPTPTPTATPIPPAIMFSAEPIDLTKATVTIRGRIDGPNGPVQVYTVDVMTNDPSDVIVRLVWEVSHADTQLLNLGDVTAQGSRELTLENVLDEGMYEMRAEKGGLDPVYSYISLEVQTPPPPPPPSGLVGVADDNAVEVQLEWDYDEGREVDITAFRVYRANMSGGGFRVVSRDADLEVNAPPTTGHWSWIDNAQNSLDPLTETCGKAYYVVAVYVNILNGDEMETAASDNSWYSQPCR